MKKSIEDTKLHIRRFLGTENEREVNVKGLFFKLSFFDLFTAWTLPVSPWSWLLSLLHSDHSPHVGITNPIIKKIYTRMYLHSWHFISSGLKRKIRKFSRVGDNLKFSHLLYKPFYSELFQQMNNHVCFNLMLISFHFQEETFPPFNWTTAYWAPQEQENSYKEIETSKIIP